MKKQHRSNLEVLNIIVAAWNLHMAEANASCAKSDLTYDQNIVDLASFITGNKVNLSDIFLSESQYANQCIEHYNTFMSLSKDIKYTKWKSLRRNPLVKTYGVMFDMYLTNGFNTDFLTRLPFLKLTKRQFAKVFIKIKLYV